MTEEVNGKSIDLIGDPILTPAELEAKNQTEQLPVNTETQQVQEISQEEIKPIITGVPDKENPATFQYWQSQADKKDQAIKALEERFNELSGRIPQPEAPKPEVLTEPQMPVMPAYYDATDAFNAPESDSFKYQRSYEQYFRDLTTYNRKVTEVTLKPFRENIQKQQELTAFQQKKAMTVGEIQGVGAQPVEAGEVFDFFTSPESLKPENLLIAFRAIQAQKQSPKLKEMANTNNPPLPPGLRGSGGEVTKTADDQFNEQMMSYKRH